MRRELERDGLADAGVAAVTIAVLPVSFMCRSDSRARLSPAGPAMRTQDLVVERGGVEGAGGAAGMEGTLRGSGIERGVYSSAAGAVDGARRLSGERVVDVGDDGPHDGRVLHEGDDAQLAAQRGQA